ncbi:S1 RNA-binding domain-containing protein [Candidatus Dependentiae bacterium]|mgnify:FL=1|nr:S1 RNA-binding domain-containing protein [Candidatus Dependentiae bacterium]
MSNLEIGSEMEGKVARILNYGAIITIEDKTGLLHNNKLGKFKKATGLLRIGDVIKVKLDEIKEDGKYSLSLCQELERKRITNKKKKRTKPYVFNPKIAWHTSNNFGNARRFHIDENSPFEDRMKAFLKDSDEKRLDIKKSLEAKRG